MNSGTDFTDSTAFFYFKLLLSGISDFRRIRLENYYYVDKTAWIPKFELVSSFLFFCRPRCSARCGLSAYTYLSKSAKRLSKSAKSACFVKNMR